MLLTIYNLPAKTRYADIKSLIQSKCGFKEVILDNLTQDNNNSKKVTVGLAEEEDAAILVRKVNGLFVDGQQLYVETIKKKPASNIMDLGGAQQPMLQQPYYQQSKYQPNYQLGYSDMQQNGAQSMALQSMGFGGVYGTNQNVSANYGYPLQMQQQMMAQSMVGFDQGAPLGFSNQGNNPSIWSNQNDWNLAGNASGGNQNSQQSRSSSRWDNNDDSSSHSRRDGSARDSGRDRPSRGYGQEAPSRYSASRRDFGRDAPSRDRGREAPSDHGRDRGRDAPARDRGRDVPARNVPARNVPARNVPARNVPARNVPARNVLARNVPARNATSRDHGRDAPFRRPEPTRAPTKRQYSPPPTLYGDHVTNTSLQLKKKIQQREGPKPNQLWGKPQLKKGKAEMNYVPPSKRPQKGAGFVKQSDTQKESVPANSNQSQTPNPKKKKLPDTPERMAVRSATWRHQVASALAKEIINNPKHQNDIPPEQFIPELKRAIRCRLEGIFGDDLEIRMPDMLKMYREKFSAETDTAFFNEVREDIKNNGSNLTDGAEKAIPVAKNPAPVASEVKINVKNEQKQQSDGPAQTIPSYPQGDKKMSKTLKKTNAQIFQDEDMLLSKMEPSTQKALNEEIDEMCTLVAKEFEDDSNPEFKNFDERVRTTVVDDFKKMIKVNLAKRMLNTRPIMLRIFNVPKTVSRSKLAPALAKYGVSSLRKSENKKPSVYYGTCETYDVHDKLCSMEPIVVDGSTVLIKPFHLTGKFDKMDKHKRVNRNKNSLPKDTVEDPFMEELEKLDEEIDEDIINLNTDYERNNSKEDDENPEIIEVNIKKEIKKIVEIVDDENTNENVKLDSIECDNAENAQITEVAAVKTESNSEKTQESVIKSVENGNESSEIKNEKSTEVDNTKKIKTKPKKIKSNVNKRSTIENLDFTADVDINDKIENQENDSFKIDAEADYDMDKVLSELNPDDLEDFRGRNIIDDIDIADLNDDDLEDW